MEGNVCLVPLLHFLFYGISNIRMQFVVKKKESGRDNYCASTGPAAFAAGREAENLVKNIVRIRRRECECGMAAKGKV